MIHFVRVSDVALWNMDELYRPMSAYVRREFYECLTPVFTNFISYFIKSTIVPSVAENFR